VIGAGQLAVVTGGSAGIGRAIALQLARRGLHVIVVARDERRLRDVVEAAPEGHGSVDAVAADLTVATDLEGVVRAVRDRRSGLDVLVHCAGTIAIGDVQDASPDDLDAQYAANVRAPYVLTQALLGELRRNRGQIVFLNSSVGLRSRGNVAQYAATQHAMKAVADALREEINPDGVRVTCVYPGRTATPRQEKLHAIEGRPYQPERLLQPDDVAGIVIGALTLPRTAEVTDISIRSMIKP
jgi:NADP-dependent 3-hydroxy acid dehydrogenase YdfG